jgi:esterase
MQLHCKQLGHTEPLVLLHGLFGSGDNWLGVAPKFAERFRVFMPDLRNHGLSPHCKEMDYPLMAADVAELLAADIETIASAGHWVHADAPEEFVQRTLAFL